MSGEPSNQPAAPAAPVAPAADPAPAPILAAAPPVEPVKPADPVAPAKPVIPEKYEFKVPEGMKLDPLMAEGYTPLFKELGLTQDQAQKLIDKNFELGPKMLEAANKQVADEIAKETADWAKTARADKEYGGANFEKNMVIANQALAAFATPELRQVLVESGYANHPELVRLFWKIGQKLGEDTPPPATPPGTPTKTANGLSYPSMTSTN